MIAKSWSDHVEHAFNGILGQEQHLRRLKRFCENPAGTSKRCWLFEGPPGIGKTLATRGMAKALGVKEDFGGLFVVTGSELNVERLAWVERQLQFRYDNLAGFNLLILEELEWVHPQVQRQLKAYLDPNVNMPGNLIVAATSNKTDGLDAALLERFRRLDFTMTPEEVRICREALRLEFEGRTGIGCPLEAAKWGITDAKGFSMRQAVDDMEDLIEEVE